MAHYWERQSDEKEEAYSAFLAYRDLGPDRTVESLQTQYKGSAKKSLSLFYRWSSKHKWSDRVRAWDNHIQRQRDREIAEYARKMERRRIQQIEDAWEDGERLRKKAMEMLELAVFEEERKEEDGDEEDGGKVIKIIKPARWMMKDLPAFLKTAAELKAAAVAAGTKPLSEMNGIEVDATAGPVGQD